jgi:hypothetical protein
MPLADHPSRCRAFALNAKGHLFALGCFERRVTIYSQQVRALTLARAMVEDGVMRTQGRVAVIGGGIGGVTLAAAITVAAPKCKVVLFEAEDRLMFLQHGGRDRFVHPHIFDWPAPGADCDDAGLPLMNWKSGPASEVVAQLAAQFDAIARHRVSVRCRTQVTDLIETGRSFKVAVAGVPESDIYDAVVLCIGFGLEKHLSAVCPSYWSPSLLPAPLLTGRARASVFVSGNGDGGLADFALAAFNGAAHGDILRLIANHKDTTLLVDKLLALDDQAWADPAFDLYSAYLEIIKPLLTEALLLDVHDRLRPEVSLVLHTQGRRLLRRDTSVLNRLVAFIALVADNHFGSQRLQASCGQIPTDPAGDGCLRLPDGSKFSPYLRLLRFGPDRDAVWAPFQHYKTGPAVVDGSQRPVTPELLPQVKEWYLERLRSREPALSPAPGTGNTPASMPWDPAVQINVVLGNVGAGASVTQTYGGPAASTDGASPSTAKG